MQQLLTVHMIQGALSPPHSYNQAGLSPGVHQAGQKTAMLWLIHHPLRHFIQQVRHCVRYETCNSEQGKLVLALSDPVLKEIKLTSVQ